MDRFTREDGADGRRRATRRMRVYMGFNPFEDWATTSRIGLDAACRAGDRAGEALSLNDLGLVHLRGRRLDRAREVRTCR